MISYFSEWQKKVWQRWTQNRIRLGEPQTLHTHNIYILPSAFGWAYGIVVFIVFIGSINYQVNTVFLMTFLMGTIGMISAWEAHANLKDISFQLIALTDAQQGMPATITLFVQTQKKIRFGLDFQFASQPKIRFDTIPPEGLQVILPLKTHTRGYFALPRIVISSQFPFGIFGVWGYAYFDAHYYVYPAAVDPGFWPVPYPDQASKQTITTGDDEFYDLKQVENPWQQPNLIAWRIAAKGQGWYLKTLHSQQVDYWLFRLDELPPQSLETNLQHLSYWLQTAEASGAVYSLALPPQQTRFANGHTHLQHCLQQLAVYV